MQPLNSAGESRRNFIMGTAAAGIAAAFPALVSSAQNAGNARRIDVHHHFEPDVFVAYRRAHNQGAAKLGRRQNQRRFNQLAAPQRYELLSILKPFETWL